MKVVDFLEDISNLTKEELERRSIPAPLDSEEKVKLTADYWTEKDGVRYLKKPLKVDYVSWGMYTLDCASLILRTSDPIMLCVVAFSVSAAATDLLGKIFFEEHLGRRGYGFFSGFSSEELNSID